MNDSDRQRGATDGPGKNGDIDAQLEKPRPGDAADDPGAAGEPNVAELDLPEEDDPVAWSYVEEGTAVVGPDGEELGVVAAMLGTDVEGIFHGVAVDPAAGGPARIVPADEVTLLTPRRVQITYGAEQLARAAEHQPREVRD